MAAKRRQEEEGPAAKREKKNPLDVYMFVGKTVIVTGASSGIGAETAREFARLGGNLVITGRDEKSLTTVRAELEAIYSGNESGARCIQVVGDLTDEKTVTEVIARAVAAFERIDVLVNNAGVISFGSIETTTLEAFDQVMDINVRSVFRMTQAAVPHLERTKGAIVNISSVNGMRSFAGVLAYCVSKAAIDQMTRCTALELAPKGIRVNGVNPGVTRSSLQLRGGLSDERYKAFLEHSKTTHALGRIGEPEEAARTIVFLASPAASFITGASIPVDGGRHAMCPR